MGKCVLDSNMTSMCKINCIQLPFSAMFLHLQSFRLCEENCKKSLLHRYHVGMWSVFYPKPLKPLGGILLKRSILDLDNLMRTDEDQPGCMFPFESCLPTRPDHWIHKARTQIWSEAKPSSTAAVHSWTRKTNWMLFMEANGNDLGFLMFSTFHF